MKSVRIAMSLAGMRSDSCEARLPLPFFMITEGMPRRIDSQVDPSPTSGPAGMSGAQSRRRTAARCSCRRSRREPFGVVAGIMCPHEGHWIRRTGSRYSAEYESSERALNPERCGQETFRKPVFGHVARKTCPEPCRIPAGGPSLPPSMDRGRTQSGRMSRESRSFPRFGACGIENSAPVSSCRRMACVTRHRSREGAR